MKSNEKDQRVRLTKLMIRSAFLKLLSEKPLRQITVRELCESAEINRGTFYTHYLDVYDLMDRIENELLEEFREKLTKLLFTFNKFSSSLEICKGIFKMLESNSDLISILLGDHGNNGLVEKFTEIGKQIYIGAYANYFPKAPKHKLELYYLFFSSGCIGLLRQWFTSGQAISMDELAGEAVKIMTHGAGYLAE